MAIRLTKAFGRTAVLRMQAAYDLAQAMKRESEIRVERYWPRPAA
jgi:plasmid maintenance system antidote protein VapI